MKVIGHSQYNEDQIIKLIFNGIKIAKGSFFEIGVNNGGTTDTLQCNTAKLKEAGWSGHWIDAYFSHPEIRCHTVTENNIVGLMQSYHVKELDFFSIDIDSHDWHVVHAMLKSRLFSIKLLCVETNNYNGHCFLDRVLKPDAVAANTYGQPKSDAFGATTFSYNLLMEKFGYKLIATSSHGVNAFFIQNKYAARFKHAGNLEILYKDSNNLRTNWSAKGNPTYMTTAHHLLKASSS